LETAYRAVLGAVQRQDDSLLLSKAVPFLSQIGGTNDPRAPQVREFYQESLLREVVRLLEAGNKEKAAELLKSSESLAKHETPARLPNPSN
jgi:hypothetical protein